MFRGHQHRLHALEMLLLSMRTPNQVLRGRYKRLSDLWLALAERRERLDFGTVARSHVPVEATGTWKPIGTAPRQEEIRLQGAAWGPRIWLRDGGRIARARWRAEEPAGYARWEDLDGEPLAFAPKEWRELDD